MRGVWGATTPMFSYHSEICNISSPFGKFCDSLVPSGSFFGLKFSIRDGKFKISEFILVIRLALMFSKSSNVVNV